MALVFVPTIGFRASGTRTLGRRAETIEEGTRLAVLAAAAATDRTEVRVEWERTGDPVSCPPDSQIFALRDVPWDGRVAASLVIGNSQLDAKAIVRRGYHASRETIGALHTITFPPLPADAEDVELRVSDVGHEWRVPFALEPGRILAAPLAAEVERDGIVVRATALTRLGDELIVGLEVEGKQQIRQVGAPLHTPLVFSRDSEEDVRGRTQAARRLLSERARPITLEVEHRAASEEIGRLFSNDPQQSTAGQPFVNRFSAVFDAPSADAKVATLLVPFIDLNDFEHSVTADLRDAPLDLALGQHRFRVVNAEPYGTDERKVELEVTPSATSPRFLIPARMQSTPSDSFSWGGAPERGEALWMATRVGDPPIVTFHGVVLRVDGPWCLELPLT